MSPRPGMDACQRQRYEPWEFTIDGAPQTIRHSSYASGQLSTPCIWANPPQVSSPCAFVHLPHGDTAMGARLFFELLQRPAHPGLHRHHHRPHAGQRHRSHGALSRHQPVTGRCARHDPLRRGTELTAQQDRLRRHLDTDIGTAPRRTTPRGSLRLTDLNRECHSPHPWPSPPRIPFSVLAPSMLL